MDADLIKTVNKLQDTFANLGGELDMPQIVVVGSQSAGKSSVLETIVGRDFLPRGQGIVTRRPLVLQLIHTPVSTDVAPGNSVPEEWAQFLHLDKRFTDFADVRKEIEQETFRVAGQNKGISKLPISLKIHSPNVLDLTLVDLPGLTKIPVGDQPSDIERQIRNLVTDYITKPNTVILAVSPANVDLANSDSLKLARTVDPQGRRTIGVLTKLDLMDAGTNALDILTGRVYPLKLGFIGVVNRSQQDINVEKSMIDARQSEAQFFETHPAYKNIAHKNGTKYLAKTLNSVLMNHIRDKLPDMKARLNTLMGQTQQELDSFGDSAAYGDANAQSQLILRLMTQFARDYVSSIDGTSLEISTKELSGGARVYYIFNDVFGNTLASIDPTRNLEGQDIRTAIRNSTGPRSSLFVPEVAFDLLVKPQIKLLEAPSVRCVEMVYEELVKICHNCTNNELARFPRLHSQFVEVVSELLRERLGPTTQYTQSLIEIQTAYINTNHPAFMANTTAVSHTSHPQTLQHKPQRPASAASINGTNSQLDDEDEDTSSEEATTSHQHEGRSVSNPSHNRSKPIPVATSKGGPSTRKQDTHPTRHTKAASVSHAAAAVAIANGSPASARETFLNYFFGKDAENENNVGFSSERLLSSIPRGAPSGRDVSLAPPELSSGLLAGKRNIDGNNAAFDMKSLGKHIEAGPIDGVPSLTAREEMEITLIRSLISSYFSIVRQSIQDLVPKAIMHLLVNHTSQHVQNRLVSALYKPDMFADLLNEDEGLVAERTRVKVLLDAYKDAFKTLSELNLKSIGP